MEGSEHEQRETAVFGRRLGDLVKTALSIVSLIVVIAGLTMFIGGIVTQISVLTTRVDAQDVRIEENSGKLDKVLDIVTEIRLNIATLSAKLGVKN